ncbi:MAG: hypothetical protein IE909_10505 [Campylobacterales bacterium]|nr:hypothetical protein [Campylobacterales bacterium]
MHKNYLMYGNCQTGALSYTLNKSQYFKSIYKQLPCKLIQNLTENDVNEVVNAFEKSDLIIYQHIGENYKIPLLSTKKMLCNAHSTVQKISFVSLYFNGYFPHLDTFNGKVSILNLVHDYVVMLCFIKGMNQQEILDMINHEEFYTKEIALEQVNQGIQALKERERDRFENFEFYSRRISEHKIVQSVQSSKRDYF